MDKIQTSSVNSIIYWEETYGPIQTWFIFQYNFLEVLMFDFTFQQFIDFTALF